VVGKNLKVRIQKKGEHVFWGSSIGMFWLLDLIILCMHMWLLCLRATMGPWDSGLVALILIKKVNKKYETFLKFVNERETPFFEDLQLVCSSDCLISYTLYAHVIALFERCYDTLRFSPYRFDSFKKSK